MIPNFPAASKSSMLEDLERGRRLELPWLSGAVVRIGKEVGVPTPIHQFITTILTPFVNGRPDPSVAGIQVAADTIRQGPANFMAEDQRLRELMREYQSGRFEAFDEIYASIAPALRPLPAVAGARRREGRRPGPGDVSADASGAAHLRPSFPLMPWAMAIARHVWLMDRRTLSRRPWAPDDVTAMELPVRGEAASFVERAEVRRALGQVAPARRRGGDSASRARIQLQGNRRARRHRRDRGEAAIESRHGTAARVAKGHRRHRRPEMKRR